MSATATQAPQRRHRPADTGALGTTDAVLHLLEPVEVAAQQLPHSKTNQREMRDMQATTGNLREIVLAVAVLTVLALALVVAGVVPSEAHHVPIHVEELTAENRGDFTDDVSMEIKRKLDGRRNEVLNLSDASHVAILRITVQPEAQFPWHIHPGPVVVTVTQGLLVYVQANDCVAREYPAGTSFVDTGNNVHTAYTPSDADETVLIATVFDAPATGALTIPQPTDPEEITELNERCGIDVGSHATH